MPTLARGFGECVGFDPRLRDNPGDWERLMLRHRDERSITLFSTWGRLLTIIPADAGFGPDHLSTERIPPPDQPLSPDGWLLHEEGLQLPDGSLLALSDARPVSSECLVPIRDFPGHMRRALQRSGRSVAAEAEEHLGGVAKAVQQHLTEVVEVPLLGLIGFGGGPELLPAGDAALCGMLLTGRAFLLGKRLRADWVNRLAMEIRRFFHRTTRVSAAWLRFAMEGRITQVQERFFTAMARDFEGTVELACGTLLEADPRNGPSFLAGVRTALDMRFQELYGQVPIA